MLFYAEVPDFYAAVERSANAALRERPVVVGGDPAKRGVVQSASRDARAAGVELGMRVAEALVACPDAMALRTDMKRYRGVDEALRRCLWKVVPALERAALGAFYFHGDDALRDPAEALPLAARLRGEVASALALELRVGIAPVKFLAKLAAEEAGQGGLLQILAGAEAAFLEQLPVERLPGVGPKTRKSLAEALGIATVGQLLDAAPPRLEEVLGNHGLRILEYAHGRDDEPVRAARHPRSLSCEHTFPAAQLDRSRLWEQLQDLARSLEEKLERQGLLAGCVGLKVRYADSGTENRSQTVARPVATAQAIYELALALLERTHAGARPVQRLGLAASKLAPEGASDRQLELFPAPD